MDDYATIVTHDDHARGCQGREYACTCGYDARVEAAITTLVGERDAALRESVSYARIAGEAQGKLEVSELAGVVDGWRERATTAETALADALAKLAAAETYFMRYCLDEADSPEYCISPQHHEDARAFAAALTSGKQEAGGGEA